MAKNGKLSLVTDGLVKNNPTFRLVLGTCPTLAVTSSALSGLAMGLATMFVLVCSNVMISLLRKVIPDKVRIPAYVMVIATFVTLVEMLMRRYLPDLYETLGLFLSLIVVNCIILARAEAFASTNTVFDSLLDGVGIGLGFTLSLTVIGIVREFLGAMKFFGLAIPGLSKYAMTVFILPAGGFLVYGMLMVVFNKAVNGLVRRSEERRLTKQRKSDFATKLDSRQEGAE